MLPTSARRPRTAALLACAAVLALALLIGLSPRIIGQEKRGLSDLTPEALRKIAALDPGLALALSGLALRERELAARLAELALRERELSIREMELQARLATPPPCSAQ